MSPVLMGAIAFIALLGCLAIGIPVVFSAAMVGTAGLLILSGPTITFMYLGTIPYSDVAYYGYTLIPLFILMGEFAFEGGLAQDLYYLARQWVGRLRGGLAMATIAGGAAFAACSGSSVASSAILSKISIPEMKRYGYSKSLGAGAIAACANLSSMIPPSGLMIVYAILTDQSVGKLLIAGVGPGILIMALFMGSVWVRCSINPTLGPALTQKIGWFKRFAALGRSWGIVSIIIIIIGGIYSGIFTPTEAGSAGAAGSFLIALVQRKLTMKKLYNILVGTAKTTSMILLIVAGIMIFTRMLSVSGLPMELARQLAELSVPPLVILVFVLLFYLFLGMFFDAISMLVITLPMFFPVIISVGYDPIWFGVMSVLMCEIGLITPPVGINCYVVAGSVPDLELGEVFRGIIPFLLMNLVAVTLLIFFPSLALFLPSLMSK